MWIEGVCVCVSVSVSVCVCVCVYTTNGCPRRRVEMEGGGTMVAGVVAAAVGETVKTESSGGQSRPAGRGRGTGR